MKKESPLVKFYRQDATQSVIASLISIAIGLALGALIVFIVSLCNDNISLKAGLDGVKLVFFGVFCTGRDAVGNLTFGFSATNWGNLLFRAIPILMTGLSVAIANKTGLFNIGAPGQYLMGTVGTLYVALSLNPAVIPAWLIWLLAFLAGMLLGAAWGCIPGLLKALRGMNEVLACIMTNWIAANLATMAFANSALRNADEAGKIGYIKPTLRNGVATAKMGLDKLFPNSQVNGGILVAILMAVLVYILLNKTTLGFELKACGSNRHAARYAGINDKRNIVLSMAIAGALAGGAAALYWLSGNTEFFWSTYQTLPPAGFNGIPVALLASNNPLGVVFAAMFMSLLEISGQMLKTFTPYNEYITDVMISAIVYLSAFSLVIKLWLKNGKKAKKNTGKEAA